MALGMGLCEGTRGQASHQADHKAQKSRTDETALCLLTLPIPAAMP